MLPLVARNRRKQTTAAVAISTLLLLSCSSAVASSVNGAASKGTQISNVTQTCEFRTINYITDSLPQQCLTSAWSSSNGSASVTSFAPANATSVGGSGGGDVEGTHLTTVDASSPSEGLTEVQDSASGETVSTESDSSSSISVPTQTTSQSAEPSATDLETGELNEASFLSFEDWKKQTLEKAGQQNANIGNKRSGEHKRRDSEGILNNLESLGDEGEIDLDFGAFRSDNSEQETDQSAHHGESETKQESKEGTAKSKDHYRSRDAGKTCKERFSYASFDAGATVVKSHLGAKNPKAVLIENKDSYMLSECTTQNKFLIIELSEDIWIDTLVLANFEFFSSMIRTFRVSVSDRYPVKMEKWKDLGIYEARNSREIQAFLIENPQIWARYIRIEFLTHYGNEYYCPLSLVRVHGSRMLESWKESEANNDDEDEEETDGRATTVDEQFIPEAVDVAVQEEERVNAELKEAQAASSELVKTVQSIAPGGVEPALVTNHLEDANASPQDAASAQMTTPWIQGFDFGAWMNVSQGLDVCLPKEAPSVLPITTSVASVETVTSFTGPCAESTSTSTGSLSTKADITSISATPTVKVDTLLPSRNATMEAPLTSASVSNSTVSSQPQSDSSTPQSSATISVSTKSQNITSSAKNKTATTSSSPSALPTQQESFFKAVSRRLQLLETNSTLSLKYIEEQSKILREAFIKVEKKQLQKSTNFLDTLNSTVLTELKEIRQQYDEIWQSTVISLESQRDESRREILAISSRLNILADEVVFQKRMSIIQSVLLLLCLGLVIFSRVSSSGNLDLNTRLRLRSAFQIESPIEVDSPLGSPEYTGQRYSANGRLGQWGRANSYRRGISEDIAEFEEDQEDEGRETDEEEEEEGEDEEVSKDEGPPTPVSSNSRSEKGFSPPSGGELSTPYTLSPQRQTLLHNSSSNPPVRTLKRSPSSSYQKYEHESQNPQEAPGVPYLDHISPSPSPSPTPSKKQKRHKKAFPRSESLSQRLQQQQVSPPPESEAPPATFDYNSSPSVNFSSPLRTPKIRSRSSSYTNGNMNDSTPTTPNNHYNHDSNPSSQVSSSTIPIVTTTPASPPSQQPAQFNHQSPPHHSPPQSPENGEDQPGHRNRRSDSESFSISRKPLPALPKEDDAAGD